MDLPQVVVRKVQCKPERRNTSVTVVVHRLCSRYSTPVLREHALQVLLASLGLAFRREVWEGVREDSLEGLSTRFTDIVLLLCQLLDLLFRRRVFFGTLGVDTLYGFTITPCLRLHARRYTFGRPEHIRL